MSEEKIIEKIKSKGYWRIEIRPTVFEELRVPTFSQVQELVQSCIVLWRGWDYPHWNVRTVRNMSDWVQSWEDWEHEIEYWRFYRSGQFVHLFALHEDLEDVDSILPKQYPPRTPRRGYVSFLRATYNITEIFEFAARLANKNILHPSAFISIGLYNTQNYELTSFDASRHLRHGYVYTADDPLIIEKEIPQQELVANPDDFALNYIIEIFERFNWNNPPREMLAEDQRRLRERRL